VEVGKPDPFLPRIKSALGSVRSSDPAALAKALGIGQNPESGGVPAMSTLAPVGDLDGDGVPEMLLKWAIANDDTGTDVAPAPDSAPLWNVYVLSWDGTGWEASRLVSQVDDLIPVVVSLGPAAGRGLAVVINDGDSCYPAIFQLRDHAATLVWDAQSDDSRYQPLLQSQVTFHDQPKAPSEMTVAGRADPGLLRIDPKGRRGFEERIVYRWDGKAYVPAKTEYFPNEDYTLYRFISALHLHDYASAYALVVPASFLAEGSPSLDTFRRFIQDHFPEFLQDEVFEAPEADPGEADGHRFVLVKDDKRNVYRPGFSADGKFRLTGLTRDQEASEP
jgi:hypothetical protein